MTEKSYMAENYHPLPINVKTAEGCFLIDENGTKYFDMLGAYSAQSMGYGNKEINEKIKAVIDEKGCPSRAVKHTLLEPFAEKVAMASGLSDTPHTVKVLPLNGGGEATGRAIKIARKFSHDVKKEHDPLIVLTTGFFHGRELVFSSNSDQSYQADGYGPAVPGIIRIPYNDISALEKVFKDYKNIAMFFTEPIQAEGGIILGTKEYFQRARELCDEHNAIFGLDEIQTGMARTGKMWCYQHFGVKPDLITIGKALGGGHVPVSAVVGINKVMDVIVAGSEGSTFGGCPLGCTAAMASIDYINNNNLTQRAVEMGEYFMAGLRNIKNEHIADIRGRGLLIGVQFKKDIADKVAHAFVMDEFMVVKGTREDTIRLAPPLTITRAQIDDALQRCGRIFNRIEEIERDSKYD
jgi:ornithine--oxo-acid transaminase